MIKNNNSQTFTHCFNFSDAFQWYFAIFKTVPNFIQYPTIKIKLRRENERRLDRTLTRKSSVARKVVVKCEFHLNHIIYVEQNPNRTWDFGFSSWPCRIQITSNFFLKFWLCRSVPGNWRVPRDYVLWFVWSQWIRKGKLNFYLK